MKRGKSVDFTGYAGTPMTAREIADALIADGTPQATRKQATDYAGGYSCCAAEA
jgi:hypothetical protein